MFNGKGSLMAQFNPEEAEQINKELDDLENKSNNTNESLKLPMEKLLLYCDYLGALELVEDEV